jgi:hypothetical protein
MPTKKETEKMAERESGTKSDVKGMDGRHEHMRGPTHSMGSYGTGSDHHDCHKGKS